MGTGNETRRGFTLLELLLVVFIIGILATLVVSRFVGVQEDVQVKAADHDIAALESALERYKLDMLKYPTTEDGLSVLVVKPQDEEQAAKWKGPYVKSINKDPWGRDYIYKCPGEHNESSFDLMSAGKDGEEGTEDDRKNWKDEA